MTSPRELWDHEAQTDPRYATLAWGGDGTPETVELTIQRILTNLEIACSIRRRMTDNEPLHVLELGCGPGRLLHRLARQLPDDHFYGMDCSEHMVRLGAADRPHNVRQIWDINIAMSQTIHPAAAFDVIYSVEVFQHIDPAGKANAMKLVARHLSKPGIGLIQFVEHWRDSEGPLDWPEYRDVMESLAVDAGLTVAERNDDIFVPIHEDWSWLMVTA